MLKAKQVAGFILHDPIGNNEGYIESASLEQLKMAQDDGCVILVQYADGDRQVIQPEDVDFSRINIEGSISVMEQEVTVPILNAMLELIESSYTPAVQVLAANSRQKVDSKLDNLKSLISDMNERYLPNIEGGDNA